MSLIAALPLVMIRAFTVAGFFDLVGAGIFLDIVAVCIFTFMAASMLRCAGRPFYLSQRLNTFSQLMQNGSIDVVMHEITMLFPDQ